jgi:nitroimidazol reductase NimA-like FMN-containing flavoprotein (pyridoxamine 5'-phosphate oxidase superfamily)
MSDYAVEELTEEECWQRLATEQIGRVAIATGGGPRIFPVNHLVHDHIVSFRTGTGQKSDESWSHPEVAFEVDGKRGKAFWSVVVEGTSTMLAEDDPTLPAAFRTLFTVDPSSKHIVISITAHHISGRQFPPHD